MNVRIPAEAFPVGTFILEEIAERSWTAERLAELTGIDRTYLQAVIDGKARLDVKMADRLGQVLGTSAEVWLNLDLVYRRWKAKGK